jgi:hypothetical protein
LLCSDQSREATRAEARRTTGSGSALQGPRVPKRVSLPTGQLAICEARQPEHVAPAGGDPVGPERPGVVVSGDDQVGLASRATSSGVTGSLPTRSPRHQRSPTPAAAMAPSTLRSRSCRPCTSEQTRAFLRDSRLRFTTCTRSLLGSWLVQWRIQAIAVVPPVWKPVVEARRAVIGQKVNPVTAAECDCRLDESGRWRPRSGVNRDERRFLVGNSMPRL